MTEQSIDPSTDESETTGPPVLQTGASGRQLGLSDIFNHVGNWNEDRYDVADTTAVQGLAATIGGCGENSGALLELRLAHHFAKLKMKVGQANSSSSSDNILVVQVIANGKQQDSRRIPFDTQQSFDIPVTDVNALKLIFFLDQDKCSSGGATAVVQGLTVSG